VTLDDYTEVPHGYPRLSTFMAHEPGAAIVRRFASINQRVLLYQQADIVCLEHELGDLERIYSEAGHRDLHYSVRMRNALPGSAAYKIWQKVKELEIALERYSKSGIQLLAVYP
jgi:hypothetical protein